jgi:hypothetical protein
MWLMLLIIDNRMVYVADVTVYRQQNGYVADVTVHGQQIVLCG